MLAMSFVASASDEAFQKHMNPRHQKLEMRFDTKNPVVK